MPTLTLSPDALVSLDRARAYLEGQGLVSKGLDMLALHVNAATGFILGFCNRKRLAWVDADITEYREGNGCQTIWTREAPIRKLTSVTLLPHDQYGGTVALTGPTPPALATSDLYFDATTGQIRLLTYDFPEGPASVKLVYRAGYYAQDQPTAGAAADPERALLELTCCELILRKWKRWQAKNVGVTSQSNERGSVTYDLSDLDAGTKKALEQFRRNMVV